MWASVVVAHKSRSTGSVAVVHGFSSSTASGILLDQGPNSCALHRQGVGSSPQGHVRDSLVPCSQQSLAPLSQLPFAVSKSLMKLELLESVTRCAALNWDALGVGDSGQFNFPVTLLETL